MEPSEAFIDASQGESEGQGDLNPDRIRENGWSQGAVVSPSDLALILVNLGEAARSRLPAASESCALLVSQDCDILCQDYDAEPEVELLLCTPVSRLDRQYTKLRNPRRLHVELSVAGVRCAYELQAARRVFVPRMLLEAISPDRGRTLELRERSLILDWITRRYIRAAFPDAFNERRRAAAKRLEKLMDRKGADVEAVFLQLSDWGELGSGEPYHVRVYVVMRTESYANRDVRQRVEKEFAAPFAQALEDCAGIEVDDYDVRPEAKFTLEDLRETLRFDTDTFSISE